MPTKTRYSTKDSVVAAYMEIRATQGSGPTSVGAVCHRAGIHRASFYRYFEGIEDLDERFLHLYFQSTVGPSPAFPKTVEELSAIYQKVVHPMIRQEAFFMAMITQGELGHYRIRWRNLIQTWLFGFFGSPPKGIDQHVWKLAFEFSLGVVWRYCELGFQGRGGLDLTEFTHRMVIYHWGGLVSLLKLESKDKDSLLFTIDQGMKALAQGQTK